MFYKERARLPAERYPSPQSTVAHLLQLIRLGLPCLDLGGAAGLDLLQLLLPGRQGLRGICGSLLLLGQLHLEIVNKLLQGQQEGTRWVRVSARRQTLWHTPPKHAAAQPQEPVRSRVVLPSLCCSVGRMRGTTLTCSCCLLLSSSATCALALLSSPVTLSTRSSSFFFSSTADCMLPALEVRSVTAADGGLVGYGRHQDRIVGA